MSGEAAAPRPARRGRLAAWLRRALAALRPTAEEAERLAAIRFPCC